MLSLICEEKGLYWRALREDYLMRFELDMKILDVRHALRHGAVDRGAVDKILYLDKQGMRRRMIEIRDRLDVGKGRSVHANRMQVIGPPRGPTLAEMLAFDPLDLHFTACGYHRVADGQTFDGLGHARCENASPGEAYNCHHSPDHCPLFVPSLGGPTEQVR